MLITLFDEFKLDRASPGVQHAEDSMVGHLSETFATATPKDAAHTAAPLGRRFRSTCGW